eukprot:Skav226962  [mRNA]  locus=scaffold51:216259:217133:- [translate_table: standard]
MLMLRYLFLALAAIGGLAMRQLEDGKTEDAMDLEETSIDWSSIPTPRTSSPLEFEGFTPSAILEETEAAKGSGPVESLGSPVGRVVGWDVKLESHSFQGQEDC